MKGIAERLGWVIAGGLGVLLIATVASMADAGPLDPPQAPGSTLPLVEPRQPISSLPATIAESGSYYLTKTLVGTGADQDGVTIIVSDVTLDLNGFTLLGVDAPGTGDGINVWPNRDNVVIKNGIIAAWPEHGILAFETTHGTFTDLQIARNGGDGLVTGAAGVVRHVSSTHNIGSGIVMEDEFGYSGGSITGSEASNNGGAGIEVRAQTVRITDNVVSANGDGGIVTEGSYAYIASNLVTGHYPKVGINVTAGFYSTVVSNVLVDNGSPHIASFSNLATGVGPVTTGGTSLTATNPFANVVRLHPGP